MKTSKNVAPSHAGTGTVDAFMAKLKHPLKADIEAVRAVILGVSPAISEEFKWNAPGFRTTESFATVHLRSTDQLQLILHLGAKVRPDLPGLKIPDPGGLMKWLGKDRASIDFASADDLTRKGASLQALLRQWIVCV